MAELTAPLASPFHADAAPSHLPAISPIPPERWTALEASLDGISVAGTPAGHRRCCQLIFPSKSTVPVLRSLLSTGPRLHL
jgi:hypothetical protein